MRMISGRHDVLRCLNERDREGAIDVLRSRGRRSKVEAIRSGSDVFLVLKRGEENLSLVLRNSTNYIMNCSGIRQNRFAKVE
jgi:hypothetical protein